MSYELSRIDLEPCRIVLSKIPGTTLLGIR